jgi:hypothetical protein
LIKTLKIDDIKTVTAVMSDICVLTLPTDAQCNSSHLYVMTFVQQLLPQQQWDM